MTTFNTNNLSNILIHLNLMQSCTSKLLQIPPGLMIIPKVNTPSHLQIRRDVGIRFGLFCSPPISQPRESVARLHIRVLPILPSRLPSHPCDMGCTAWPQSVDPPAWSSAVGPRTAVLAQDCSWEESITVFDKIICSLFLRRHGCDVLVGDFAQDLGHEGDLCFGYERLKVRRTTSFDGMGVTHRHA
jgi:hypothetical protein